MWRLRDSLVPLSLRPRDLKGPVKRVMKKEIPFST